MSELPPFPIRKIFACASLIERIESTSVPSASSKSRRSPRCVVISTCSSRRANAERYPRGAAPISSIMTVLSRVGRGVRWRWSPLWRKILEPVSGRVSNRARVPHRRRAPVFDVLEHDADAGLKRHSRLPAEPALNLADVGKGAVRLARTLGHVHDVAADQLQIGRASCRERV